MRNILTTLVLAMFICGSLAGCTDYRWQLLWGAAPHDYDNPYNNQGTFQHTSATRFYDAAKKINNSDYRSNQTSPSQ